jgi:Tol biopolymer transport system component
MSSATFLDLLRFDLETGAVEPLIATPYLEDQAALSPDDRLLAYLSEEPGRPEIFITSLGDTGGRWQVSNDGGSRPRWRADGRQLFYYAPPDRIMVVDVEPGEVPRFSVPRLLFRSVLTDFDVAPDGESFVATRLTDRGAGEAFRLVTHWPSLLGRGRR